MKNHHCLLLPIGLILIVIGSVTLAIFGVGNLEPYGYTKNFEQSTCTVLSSNITTYHACEHINPVDSEGHEVIYSSGHSCLRVLVNYTEKNHGEVKSFVYNDYETLQSTKYYNDTCAIHICMKDESDNEEDVREFEETYGTEGQSYTCFYNPRNREEVFVEVMTSSQVLHALLWPGLALGFGIFILIVVIFSSCEVWVCMPWRNKRAQEGEHCHHHHHGHHHQHKHSYALATVQYGQDHEENKSTYKA